MKTEIRSIETGQLFGSNPEIKVSSQKPKKTTQRNHKMMIKWTKQITSWHTFHFPFQILIYYKYNNVRASISRSNKHIPDYSQLPQTGCGTGQGSRRVPGGSEYSLPARLLPRSSWPTVFFLQTANALPACLLQVSAPSPLPKTLPDPLLEAAQLQPRLPLRHLLG